MAPKFGHFIEEADIGSGEKTPAELEDLEKTAHLREQQEQARQQARPMDGALLQQVIEEQLYINQQESHTPHGALDGLSSGAAPSADPATPLPSAPPPKTMRRTKKSARSPTHHGR
ncbi:hypothetical protein [Noviherbaspirillum sedimenti]|nr:hypothetical protein [Noviherbaspirillum sedimenti]